MPRVLDCCEIESIDDPRIARYRDLRIRRDRWRAEPFVCEGALIVNRLLASDLHVESILVQRGRQDSLIDHRSELIPSFVVDKDQIRQIVGFDLHRGVLVIGGVPKIADVSQWSVKLNRRDTLVALLNVHDPENLGSLIRTCAAFGVRAILLMGSSDSRFFECWRCPGHCFV